MKQKKPGPEPGSELKPESEPSASSEPDELVDQLVLKRWLGVSEMTLRRYWENDLLPRPLKLGHLNRWWRSEIEAAIAALARKPVAKKGPALRRIKQPAPTKPETPRGQPRRKQPARPAAE